MSMDIGAENAKVEIGPGEGEFLARAAALRELVKSEAEKSENAGRTSLKVVEAFREAGLFWLLVPRSVGGHDTSTVAFARMVEEIASADACTAWSMMSNGIATMVASIYCSDEHVARMFGGSHLPVMAATYAPTGKAVRDGESYLCSGRYGFGSGISHADWASSAFVLHEDGKVAMQGDGNPRVVGAFVETSRINILGNWDVVGLQATGSYDYEVPEQKIPESWTFNQYWTEPQRSSRMATLGTITAVCAGHTAELLGIARRSLHEAARMASQKKRLYAAQSIADSPTFRLDFVRNEALFQAARALAYDVFAAADRNADAGKALSQAEIQRVRQVATWVHQVCRDIAVFAFGSVSSSLRKPSALGRNLVDAAVGVQHLIVNQMTLMDASPFIIEKWAEASAQSVE
jgi:alkylation response protein AidB-like acyl-CoA dehydrogenase